MTKDITKKRSIGEILKHPLANVVIGFLLTGVLGTAITQYYIALRQKQDQQRELETTRKEAIAELAALNAEYLAHAEMLLDAIDRGDESGAKKLKAMFDEARMRWQTKKAPALMAARDILPHDIYIQLRDNLDQGFRDRFLVPLGVCEKNAADALAEGSDMSTVLRACHAREYLEQASDCSQSLLDMLYELSAYTVEGEFEEEIQAKRDTYRALLQQACLPIQ